jgi:hypothetical protein
MTDLTLRQERESVQKEEPRLRRMVRWSTVLEMYPYSRQHICKLIKAGRFPAPVDGLFFEDESIAVCWHAEVCLWLDPAVRNGSRAGPDSAC